MQAPLPSRHLFIANPLPSRHTLVANPSALPQSDSPTSLLYNLSSFCARATKVAGAPYNLAALCCCCCCCVCSGCCVLLPGMLASPSKYAGVRPSTIAHAHCKCHVAKGPSSPVSVPGLRLHSPPLTGRQLQLYGAPAFCGFGSLCQPSLSSPAVQPSVRIGPVSQPSEQCTKLLAAAANLTCRPEVHACK